MQKDQELIALQQDMLSHSKADRTDKTAVMEWTILFILLSSIIILALTL